MTTAMQPPTPGTRVPITGRRAHGTWTVTARTAGAIHVATAPTLAEALRRLPHGGPR